MAGTCMPVIYKNRRERAAEGRYVDGNELFASPLLLFQIFMFAKFVAPRHF